MRGGRAVYSRNNRPPSPLLEEAVAPGPVSSPVNPSGKEANEVTKFGANTPMTRPAQPEELAPAYVFLVSPQCSSCITGEVCPSSAATEKDEQLSAPILLDLVRRRNIYDLCNAPSG